MSQPFLGEVRTFAFDFAPVGWMPCQGQELRVSQNQALFALLGTSYGGDGETNFALPTLAPLDSRGGALGYFIAVDGVFPPRP